ncbi:MAG: hypothetical protein AAB365_01900 [Patescibacteria group bacterium]
MNKAFWSFGIAGCLFLETVHASESTNREPPTLTRNTNELHITQTISSTRFTPRWREELVPAGSRIFYDRFGSPSSLSWMQLQSAQGYGIHEYMNTYGGKTIYKIMGAAAREAAVETFPVGEYEDMGRNLGHRVTKFFGGLFRGSIGNTAEEDMQTVSATPSYNSLRHIVNFEWNDSKDPWSGEYGWRPWRDNPYVYLNSNLGHHQGRQFIRTEMRCYGYLRPNSFGMIKTEASAIITLARRSQLVVGGYAYPFENELQYKPQASVRFETFWRESLFSVGVASSSQGPFWNFMAEFRF